MKTPTRPTKEALRAARILAHPGDDVSAWAKILDSAAGLPALLAERDTLRTSLETALKAYAAQAAARLEERERLREALGESLALNLNWTTEASVEDLEYYSEYKRVIAQARAALATTPTPAASAAIVKTDQTKAGTATTKEN